MKEKLDTDAKRGKSREKKVEEPTALEKLTTPDKTSKKSPMKAKQLTVQIGSALKDKVLAQKKQKEIELAKAKEEEKQR